MRISPTALALCTALLGGCASAPPPPVVPLSTAPVAPYRAEVALTGRLSVNYEKEGQPAVLTGKFDWLQQADRVEVSLASPFGQTIAKITVTPREATLTQGSEAPRSAPDIDSLTAQTLGWSLPVSGLRDWLQGYATAQDGGRFAASPARSTVTTRDGWRLHFVSWQDEGAAQPQPKRIDAERGVPGSPDALAIRIVLDPQA